ncbi:M6 family metalloprotease domain-containing protein [Streptomyces roseus]|uniref:M6 family metalloprotease domain-containing protein n=1 Tax=Streptomyces roseus TaxID=66430 RepID=UPI003818F45B
MARHRRTKRITGAALAAAVVAGAVLFLTTSSDPASAIGSTAAPKANSTAAAATACKLPATSAYMSEGFTSQDDFVASTGTLKATMIFVDFPDAPADDSTTNLYDELAPGASQWFKTASYGKLDLTIKADTSRFYRMPRSASSYGYERGLSYESHQQYIQDAVQTAGRLVDFRGTQLLYIVPTRRASAISFSPTFMGSVTAADGTSIAKTVTFGQDLWTWGSNVVNHETGHAMGLPDLYSFASGGPDHPYVGGWDMMGLISGPAPDHFAWHKWKHNWITDAQVGCVAVTGTTSHRLTSLETAGGKKIIVVKTHDTRAIVAEVRSAKGNDAATCATGVLIYTVDTDIRTGSGPIRVQDARPGSGGCSGNELGDATYGYGPGSVSHYRDGVSGVTIDVTSRNRDGYTLAVRK